MPQISPLSWVFIPLLFFFVFLMLMIGMWWVCDVDLYPEDLRFHPCKKFSNVSELKFFVWSW